MFKTPSGIDTIELKWYVQEIETDEKTNIRTITYERIKDKEEDLKTFIYSELKGLKSLKFDFVINGIDFTDWINTYFYGKEVLNTDMSNSIIQDLTNYHYEWLKLDDFDIFDYVDLESMKLFLKQLMGQPIQYQDAYNYAYFRNYEWVTDPKYADTYSARLEEIVKLGLKEYNNDQVWLFRCSICRDTLCSGYPITVKDLGHRIQWNFGDRFRLLHFDKQQYYGAFQEFLEMLNTEIVNKRQKLVPNATINL